MTEVTLLEASQHLPELLAAAAAGEGVVIVQDDGWAFRVVPTPPGAAKRPARIPRAGSCAGLIQMADDFDAPLDELREYME